MAVIDQPYAAYRSLPAAKALARSVIADDRAEYTLWERDAGRQTPLISGHELALADTHPGNAPILRADGVRKGLVKGRSRAGWGGWICLVLRWMGAPEV